jgi:isopenicillin-N epimerase
MARNRALALRARSILNAALDTGALCPETMIGSLAAVPLPDGSPEPPASALHVDPLHTELFERFGIEVPVALWPAPPKRLLRISAQIYNTPAEYQRLAEALGLLLASKSASRGQSFDESRSDRPRGPNRIRKP